MALVRTITTLFLVLTLAACASQNLVQPASEQLGMAKAALEQARVSDADKLAPELFRSAEHKIVSAEEAINDREALTGEALAHEATLDARLARLHADRITNQQLVNEIQATIDALEDEISAAR